MQMNQRLATHGIVGLKPHRLPSTHQRVPFRRELFKNLKRALTHSHIAPLRSIGIYKRRGDIANQRIDRSLAEGGGSPLRRSVGRGMFLLDASKPPVEKPCQAFHAFSSFKNPAHHGVAAF